MLDLNVEGSIYNVLPPSDPAGRSLVLIRIHEPTGQHIH